MPQRRGPTAPQGKPSLAGEVALQWLLRIIKGIGQTCMSREWSRELVPMAAFTCDGQLCRYKLLMGECGVDCPMSHVVKIDYNHDS